jgi:hypothetical protein
VALNKDKVYTANRKWRKENPKKAQACSRNWKVNNPEKVKESLRVWQANNREKCREYSQKWRANNLDAALANSLNWRNNNLELSIKRAQEWHRNNPEQVKVHNRKATRMWRKNHPDKARESTKKWAEKNPDLFSTYIHKRRARKEGNGGAYTSEEIRALFVSQEYTCYYCNKPFFNGKLDIKFHIDHKTPLSRGGTSDISNIALACPKCNLSKNTKTDIEFIDELRRI